MYDERNHLKFNIFHFLFYFIFDFCFKDYAESEKIIPLCENNKERGDYEFDFVDIEIY